MGLNETWTSVPETDISVCIINYILQLTVGYDYSSKF